MFSRRSGVNRASSGTTKVSFWLIRSSGSGSRVMMMSGLIV